MKAALIILITLPLFFIHADALKCRQSSCIGTRTCTSITVTCRDKVDHCFLMMRSTPIFTMTRGCVNEANCMILKGFEASTRCCKTDLCN